MEPHSSSPLSSRIARATAILAILAASAAAQTSPVPGTVPITQPIDSRQSAPPTGNFFDNTKGNLVRFQLGHIQPIAIDPVIGDYLFAPNNAGQRLTITYLPSNTLVTEIPTGPGITAFALRPGTSEIWAVDSVNSCISVIDPIAKNIVRTIPVHKEPYGIAFLSTGARAYVTCSGSSPGGNAVDVVDCASYSVGGSVPIPDAMGPRGIVVESGDARVWVTPFFSGNNSVTKRTDTTSGNSASQAVVNPNPGLNETPLLDKDLFALTVTNSAATDALDTTRTKTGLGTILFNLHARPSTNELWIPNTDALNQQIIGEKNFVGGKVVSNRITIVDTVTNATQFIDLDVRAAAFSVGAAQPTAVAFDTARNRAYVSAFGSDVILVLDTSTNAYAMIGRHILTPATPPMPAGGSTPTPTPARCGPRGMVISRNNNELFVFNGIDNSYSRVDLTSTSTTAPTAIPLGFDPTPNAWKRGLGHLANADLSSTKTSSCMSCHVDGHLDMLSWNLSAFSDPAGTANPSFEKDNKGPMATQSLRGLFEAGTLHWRGERANLAAFNGAFVDLLKRSTPLTTEQFAELQQGTFSLAYPSNPREPANRVYTGSALNGLTAFRTMDAVAPGAGACAGCHTLPTGTSAEIQGFIETASPAGSGKVAQLRGVSDKLAAVFTVFPPTFGRRDRTANGWGLTHSATVASLTEFIQTFPNIAQNNAVNDVAAFVDAFDTGLAPATTYQRTINPSVNTSTDFTNVLNEIRSQAVAGNCDVVVAGSAMSGGAMTPFTMCFDHILQKWQTGTAGAAFDDAQLQQFTFSAGVTITFFGQPLGTGRRFGVDRDLDGLLDNDEQLYGPPNAAYATNPDWDNDGFPDGHEAANPGMDPRAFNATSTDTTSPSFTSAITMVYFTTNTAKLEFSTDEPTRAEISAGPTGVTFVSSTSPSTGGFDLNHVIFVRDLPANLGTPNNVFTVRITDPAGHPTTGTVALQTLTFNEGTRVVSITNQPFASPNMTVSVQIGQVVNTAGTLCDGSLITAFAYCEAPGTGLTPISLTGPPPAATPNRTATFVLQIPQPVLGAAAGSRKLYFGVRAIQPNAALLAYLEAKDIENFKTIKF